MMKSSSAFTQSSITHMGAFAHACLVSGRSGEILAAFSKAIYLLTDDSELFWIVSEDAPMHRRALKTSAPLSGLQAGSPFYVHDQHLIIDSAYVFNMDRSSIWNAPSISQNNIVEINDIPERIHIMLSSLDLSQTKGFGNFIPDILRLARNEHYPQAESSDPILAFAHPNIMDMASACLENQPARISRNADALIGLGIGLTPSGDDFVGGLLFCIYNLQIAHPELNLFNPLLLEHYRKRTHQISFTLLQDLANGYAVAPLHQIINGILDGESFESIQPSILQLMQIGHSTGWDMLTGLLTGLLTAYRSNYLISSFQSIQSIES